MKWNFWATSFWMFWLFAFIVWEAYAASKGMGNKDVPMLTQAVVRYIPFWITIPFLLWLLAHFAIRYFNPEYVRWLHTGKL